MANDEEILNNTSDDFRVYSSLIVECVERTLRHTVYEPKIYVAAVTVYEFHLKKILDAC